MTVYARTLTTILDVGKKYDRKAHGKSYEKGIVVWLHNAAVLKGKSKKLHKPWEGPFRVVKKMSDVTYRVQLFSNHRSVLYISINSSFSKEKYQMNFLITQDLSQYLRTHIGKMWEVQIKLLLQ